MKKLILYCLSFFCTLSFLQGQTTAPQPCGTIGGKSVWLKKYQANPDLAIYQKNNDSTIYVPLTLHLVGSDGNTGYFPFPRLLEALCTLNDDFLEANIQFYIEGEINYLANSAYNSHETVVDGAYMMFDNNVENTLNCYVVNDPAGNCGYNLPYAGIALMESCIGPTDHTWAHEVGHALSLPHPFLGWEGGVSHDGSVGHNFNNPAPTQVLYDYTNFQDSFFFDTLIVDTAIVELVDGSNCYIAADGFCDTAPDYLASRWNCNASNQSNTLQTDPNGAPFYSDASLIMSYSFDDCQSRFTEEQIAAMRANLFDEKPHLLQNQEPGLMLSSNALALYGPIEGELAQYDDVYFDWEEMEGVTSYFVQVSRFSTFNVIEEYVATTNSLHLTTLLNNKTYYWRVKPYNAYSFCTAFSETGIFETGEVTAIGTLSKASNLIIYPNLAPVGQQLQIDFNTKESFDLSIQLLNSVGQTLKQQAFSATAGRNMLTFGLPQAMPTGAYFLKLSHEEEAVFEKIIITQD